MSSLWIKKLALREWLSIKYVIIKYVTDYFTILVTVLICCIWYVAYGYSNNTHFTIVRPSRSKRTIIHNVSSLLFGRCDVAYFIINEFSFVGYTDFSDINQSWVINYIWTQPVYNMRFSYMQVDGWLFISIKWHLQKILPMILTIELTYDTSFTLIHLF